MPPFYRSPVQSYLRFVGLLNAAVWLGSGVFFTFIIGPAVFSDEMKRIFGPYYPGIIAQMFLSKYFILNLVCGLVALGHFASEVFYARRGFQKWLFIFLIVPLLLGVFGGFVLQPKLRVLHNTKYRDKDSAARDAAAKQFTTLHIISANANLLGLILLVAYTWRVANPPEQARFVSAQKFRG